MCSCSSNVAAVDDAYTADVLGIDYEKRVSESELMFKPFKVCLQRRWQALPAAMGALVFLVTIKQLLFCMVVC